MTVIVSEDDSEEPSPPRKKKPLFPCWRTRGNANEGGSARDEAY